MRMALLPAAALAIAIAACGGDGNGTTGSGGSTTATTTTTTTTTATTTTTTTATTGTGGMGGMGGMGGVGGAGGLGGMGGQGGTGGAGGAGGAGGKGGMGGAGGEAGAGGLGGGLPNLGCHWMGPEVCDPGFYCDAPGCDAGTCTKKPEAVAIDKTQSPVCGCDGTTYWNADVAALNGVATQAMSGACAGGSVLPCDDATPCPLGYRCNRPVTDASQCMSAGQGECWIVPVQCALDGEKARACTNMNCETICSLIQSQNPWFADGSCQ